MKRFIFLIPLLGLLISPVAAGSTVLALDKSAEAGFKSGIDQSGGSGAEGATSIMQSSINLLIFIAGMIAVIVIVIAGIRFVTSNGDSSTTSKARNEIIYAAVGLVVALSAYVIVNFIIKNI